MELEVPLVLELASEGQQAPCSSPLGLEPLRPKLVQRSRAH